MDFIRSLQRIKYLYTFEKKYVSPLYTVGALFGVTSIYIGNIYIGNIYIVKDWIM